MKYMIKKRILIADDDNTIRMHLTNFLKIRGYDVVEASNSQEAYTLLTDTKYSIDLLILDIQMPHGDGLSLAELLHKEEYRTPIAILSSYSDRDKLLRAIKINVVDYLIKPFTRKSIEELLYKVFNSYEIGKKEHLQDEYIFYFQTLLLYKEDKCIKLTKMQTLMLKLLLERKNQIVSNEEIYYHINGDSNKDVDVSVRNTIRHLRAILPPETIETIYGLGYRIIV